MVESNAHVTDVTCSHEPTSAVPLSVLPTAFLFEFTLAALISVVFGLCVKKESKCLIS